MTKTSKKTDKGAKQAAYSRRMAALRRKIDAELAALIQENAVDLMPTECGTVTKARITIDPIVMRLQIRIIEDITSVKGKRR